MRRPCILSSQKASTYLDQFSQVSTPCITIQRNPRILPKGKALDIAIGEGRNTLFLAANGFDMEGLDRDPRTLEVCQDLARRKNLTIKTRKVDLENYPLPVNHYDLIICFYYLQRSLIPQMKKALKKGGVLVYETFLMDQHLLNGTPKHKEYCFEHNELLAFFSEFRILYYREGNPGDTTISVSLVAKNQPLPQYPT